MLDVPGDFFTNVKQINSQSDLISMSIAKLDPVTYVGSLTIMYFISVNNENTIPSVTVFY